MAKNYGVKDFFGDILAGMAGITPLYEAQAAGMPEAAGTSPEVFRALMGQKGMEPAMALREREVGIRESALGLQEERNKLARERLQADIDYRNKIIKLKKDWFGQKIKEAAANRTDPKSQGFVTLSQAAIKALGVQDKTPSDIGIINQWAIELEERGIDMSGVDFQEEPGFFSGLFSGIKSTAGKVKEGVTLPKPVAKPKPATKPKLEHREDPAGLGI